MTRTSPVPATSESVIGGATILPGIPLPSWGRPEEPIEPEPTPVPLGAGAAGGAVLSVGEPEPPASDSASADSFLLEAVAAAAAARAAAAPPAPEPEPAPSAIAVLTPPAPEAVAAESAAGTAAEATSPEAPTFGYPQHPVEAPAAEVAAIETVVGETVMAEAAEADAPVDTGRRSHRRFGRRQAAAAVVATEAVVADDAEAIPQLAPPTPVPPRAELYAAAGAAPPTAPWGTPPATVPVGLLPPTTEPVELAAADSEPVPDEMDDERSSSGGSRRSLVALGALGGVLVLGAVAAFVWPGFLVAADTPTTPAPRPAVSVSSSVTLSAPASVAGMTQLTGAPAAALAKAASTSILAGYAAPVSAVYGTGTTPAATVLAWKATRPGSPADVVTAFGGYQGTTGQPVTGIAPVDTGKLGGQMSCGSSVVGGTPASVCFWSDDATFGAVTVLRPVDAAAGATTAVAIRTAMEKKS